MSGLEELWFQSCKNQNIPHETAKSLLHKIQSKFNNESHRIYHNLNVLNKKCNFLLSLKSSVQYSDYLVFAIFFQYYHFDLKTDCSEMNWKTFRELCKTAGIDNVSLIYNMTQYDSIMAFRLFTLLIILGKTC